MRKAQIERIFMFIVIAVIVLLAAWILLRNVGKPDCDCKVGELCVRGVCTTASQQQSCGDGRCARDESCENCPADCVCENPCPSGDCGPVCGNGECETGEDCLCSDCACSEGSSCDSILKKCIKAKSCGDGVCAGPDNCGNCPSDCPCAMGKYCDKSRLICVESACGNGKCEPFENQENCCEDCLCTTKYMVCKEHLCQYPSPALTNEEAESIAVNHLKTKGLTVTKIVEIRNFVWEDSLSKKITFETVEQSAPCVVIVKESREVQILITY